MFFDPTRFEIQLLSLEFKVTRLFNFFPSSFYSYLLVFIILFFFRKSFRPYQMGTLRDNLKFTFLRVLPFRKRIIRRDYYSQILPKLLEEDEEQNSACFYSITILWSVIYLKNTYNNRFSSINCLLFDDRNLGCKR